MAINGAVKWMVAVGIGLMGAIGTVVSTWALYGAGIEDNAKETVELKEDGCRPAQIHTTQIAVIQTTQQIIQADISDIKEAQTKGFAEILRRLPEK